MSVNAHRVRELLGERIPVGGTAEDTMFTDAQIEQLLTDHDNDLDEAVGHGWKIKAAEFANLVDTAEGTSKRSMSDLHQHALRMAASFGVLVTGLNTTGRTRIRQITRS